MVHDLSSARENLSSGSANIKGADQPAHPRILISAFVIRFLENIISSLATIHNTKQGATHNWSNNKQEEVADNIYIYMYTIFSYFSEQK